MFYVDGVEWRWPCDIERAAEMTPSQISGLMLDGSVFNDVLGTYMRYTVTVVVPLTCRDEYAALYEILTQPVDGHRFLLPYNNGWVEVTGRVARVGDVYVRMPDGGSCWKGARFTVEGNHPTKAMSLGEVIAAGRAPLPEVAAPEEGACYAFHDGAWVETVFEDGDEREY
ncbi:MAG: hypothetical protein IJH86_03330 [Clostridia bacterium]|nr:hypothetical protein [Clostridia bacterium]